MVPPEIVLKQRLSHSVKQTLTVPILMSVTKEVVKMLVLLLTVGSMQFAMQEIMKENVNVSEATSEVHMISAENVSQTKLSC